MVGEAIRRWGFWSLDLLKGSKVRKHFKEIKYIMEKKELNNIDLTDKYLDDLLNHAVNTTKYYSKYKDYKDLNDFPILDKNIIKGNQEQIMSGKYKDKELHSMSTSGSTGTPFTIKQDERKRNRVLAEVIYFGELCGYRLGYRNTFLRVWTEKNKKSSIGAWMQNLVMIDISKLDKESLESIRNILKKDKKLKCILGYASTLDVLSKYLLDKGDTPDMFGVEIVISGAEVLSEITRLNLKKVFGSNVVSRYSNQENGFLAQELVDSDYFIINNANYHIEFLKLDSDEEAEIGELSRIVVTDLFNYATPVIRYDTGDLAILEEHSKYGKVIKNIEGRIRDFIYDTSGGLLSPSAITVNMWKFDKVKQYQLIQNTKTEYILKLNGAKNIYDEEDIINTLKKELGEDAEITVEHVDGIPFLKSGKFQTVVCNL